MMAHLYRAQITVSRAFLQCGPRLHRRAPAVFSALPRVFSARHNAFGDKTLSADHRDVAEQLNQSKCNSSAWTSCIVEHLRDSLMDTICTRIATLASCDIASERANEEPPARLSPPYAATFLVPYHERVGTRGIRLLVAPQTRRHNRSPLRPQTAPTMLFSI